MSFDKSFYVVQKQIFDIGLLVAAKDYNHAQHGRQLNLGLHIAGVALERLREDHERHVDQLRSECRQLREEIRHHEDHL